MIKRCSSNPVITKDMVKPSNPLYEVKYVTNPGACEYDGKIILFLRVAEGVKGDFKDVIKIPASDGIIELQKDLPGYDYSDPRVIRTPDNMLLTTMSHFRIASSTDGVNFTVDDKPAMYPECVLENYGIEDARITRIDGTYYIAYAAVSCYGVIPFLAATDDFITFKKLGPIFHPTNKDVVLFPEKIGGEYVSLLRPSPTGCGTPDIWLARSPDLLHWGEYSHILSAGPYEWNNGRIGAGIPPIKTDSGWLALCHASSVDDVYCMSAVLLDLDDPGKVIATSSKPIMLPEECYEKEGFFGNVIFPTGGICRGNKLRFYYGASDTCVCTAETTLDYILDSLK